LLPCTRAHDSGRPITPEALVNRIREEIKSGTTEAYSKALDINVDNFKEFEDGFA
jgi:hypothetical protein